MQPRLRYFTPSEFRGWWTVMDPEILTIIDNFRHEWGAPVFISPVDGAIGRRLRDSQSQHNIEKWGEVRAVDLMPQGMKDRIDFKRAFECAKKAKARGIGIYPDWTPPGIHLDSRRDRYPSRPATWSAFNVNGKQTYFTIDKALK